MDDRRRLKATRIAQDVRAVQHKATGFALALAGAQHQEREADASLHHQDLERAYDAWTTHLGDHRLDREIIAWLRTDASKCEHSFEHAQAALDEAGRMRREASLAHGQARIRLHQASHRMAALRKRARRRREERALSALEIKFANRDETPS